jgi:hypothetical protein
MNLNVLQVGIFNRLKSQITTIPIYDFVPQSVAAPYVVIGDDTAIDFDTKTDKGVECTLTIHAWDYAKNGRKSVKDILSSVYTALHNQENSVTLTQYNLLMLRVEFQESFQENINNSDRFYHGVIRLRAILME